MDAEDLPVNNGGDGHHVKDLVDLLPDLLAQVVAELLQALGFECEVLLDDPAFMVAWTKNRAYRNFVTTKDLNIHLPRRRWNFVGAAIFCPKR